MGVDIQTYRSRIGTYKHSSGTDVVTIVLFVHFSQSLKYVGCVIFIGLLLIMAGIEQNPGPWESDTILHTSVPCEGQKKIFITGLPKQATSEVLSAFFENENENGGGPVKEVTVNDLDQSAIVEFIEADAVDKVMQKLPATLYHKEINIQVIPFNETFNAEITKPKRLFVTGLSEDITDKMLCMYFENENRNGGGRIQEAILDVRSHSAVIEFEEANAVEKVMTRLPAMIGEHVVHVKVIPTDFPKLNIPSKKVKVTGFPKAIEDEILVMYFENENRQGGGKIKHLIMDEDRTSAIIEFEEARAADTVMRQQPINVQGSKVNVVLLVDDDVSELFKKLQHDIAEDIAKATKKIKVTGLPKNITNEILSIVFENENRQGGGRVKHVNIDPSETFAIIEFEERKAAEIVLKNQPINVLGTDVNVDLFCDDDLSNLFEKQEQELDETIAVDRTKVKVTGLPKDITNDILAMVFENENRQGGGRVKHVNIDPSGTFAIIEFEERKAVETVLKKQPIRVLTTDVNVDLFLDEEPMNSTNNKLIVSELPMNTSEEALLMFFENEKRQGGGKVVHVSINEDERSAIIEFEENKAVETVLQKQPIYFETCQVTVRNYTQSPEQVFVKPTRILVTGISDTEKVSKEFLTMFFENEKRQGGGKVSSVHITDNGHSSIIEFEDAAAVDKVLQKKPIKMMDNEVSVVVFSGDDVSIDGNSTKLKVTFPQPVDITQEFLINFFEDEHRKGGGIVNCVDIDASKSVVIIDFADETAVDSVLQKLPIYIMGHQVAVEKYKSEQSKEASTMLVSGLPENISEDYLIPFFENENRQGGGEIVSVEVNKKCQFAIIEFKESMALKNVLRKQPIQISGQTVGVRPFTGSRFLEVSGFTFDKTTETDLKTYFESKDVSAGEPVKSVEISTEKQNAIITFDNARGVLKVMSRRNHIFRNTKLVVNTFVTIPPESKQPPSPYFNSRNDGQESEKNKPEQDRKKMEDTEDEMEIRKTQIMKNLGLSKYIGGHITIKDMITVDPYFECVKNARIEELPWVMLKRLMSVNSDAMDLRLSNDCVSTQETNRSVSAMYGTTNQIEGISPLDVFLLVFQCCDPMLKQLLYQKLYLCKMAVPFIYHDYISSQSTLAKSPLRSLFIESKNTNGENVEVEVLDMPTRVIAFARFERPKFSRSRLLNHIISETGADTFFHRDCPLGTTKKYVADGYTEMFWLPAIGDTRCKFRETVTFFNMRGNIRNAFEEEERSFIAAISDISVVICGIDSILNDFLSLEHSINRFSAVLLVIADPFDKNDLILQKKLLEFQQNINGKLMTNLQIICTHDGLSEKSATEVRCDVTECLSDYLKRSVHLSKSLQERIDNAFRFSPKVDEDESCIEAKKAALSVIKTMDEESCQQDWLFVITPVQSTSSSNLSDLLKQQHREKDFTLHGQIKEKMTTIRNSQTETISNSMQKLMNNIINFAGSYSKLHIFLNWLRYFLERKKRNVLPGLMKKNQLAWDTYWKMKKEFKPSVSELDNQEMKIKQLEGEIEKASFGIENLFREIFHICDAILLLKKDRALNLCQVSTIADVIAQLVSNGQVIELLDGNSFYMPVEWIKLVLNKIHKIIGEKKVLTLSVLGLQSSGKSTLLNTMFGIQFSASSGRCTRGIHMQLLPLKQQIGILSQLPFEYILVIDTEGLRAPELSNKNYKRDNELSTIITGLGDISILNVMGENTTELRDILQILIHAFLRLKLANDRLDIRKSCYFIHQNVTDITASEKMKTGLQLSIRNLDSVTEESALSEGISNIHTFNQVLEFDTEKNVWYLPNLWQGNPPLARVNRKYSEAVVNICHKLILKCFNDTTKSFKTLDNIVIHTEDLWKGVLAEDFVFSFRNSLEKRAYVDLETKLKSELWIVEKRIDSAFNEISQNHVSQCDDKHSLTKARVIIIAEVTRILSAEETSIIDKMNGFFNTNDFKDTVIQWKQQTMNHIRSFCKELIDKKQQEVDVILDKRAVDIMTNSKHKIHEEELRRRSIELANELKGTDSTTDEIDKRFEVIWNTFVSESLKFGTLSTHQPILKQIFIKILSEMYDNHPVLTEVLKEQSWPAVTRVLKLSKSFKCTNITEKDISIKTTLKAKIGTLPLIKYLHESPMVTVEKRVEKTFEIFDFNTTQLCKEDNVITDQKVKCFLKDVDKLICDIGKTDDPFTLKINFKIKIAVFVSRFALSYFEKHNEEYNRTHGLDIRLEKYKQKVKERFNAHLHECKVEETAAKMFRISMEDFVFETVKARLPSMVKHYLRGQLPQLKFHLIIEILTDLVDRNQFEDWVFYIENPKAFADRWITKKSERLLFDQESGKYYDLASDEIENCLKQIVSSITQSRTQLDKISSIHDWVDIFLTNLNTYKLPKECLIDVVRELEHADAIHFDYFTDMLTENIKTSGINVQLRFKQVTKDTIKWTPLSPYKEVCENIWGCPEMCIFCGEPCIKCNIHEGSSHNCLQHRPTGCRGVHDSGTLKIALTSCNFNVASSLKARCSLYNYLCNKPTREPCKLQRHPYKQYRDYIKNWDIEPTTDMEERSKFWMWHIATYKEELEHQYGIDMSDVPKYWGNISKKEALESLRNLYAKGGK